MKRVSKTTEQTGIVINIEDNKAIILTNNGTFIKITNSDNLKIKQKVNLDDFLSKKKQSKLSKSKVLIATATLATAIMAGVLLSSLGFFYQGDNNQQNVANIDEVIINDEPVAGAEINDEVIINDEPVAGAGINDEVAFNDEAAFNDDVNTNNKIDFENEKISHIEGQIYVDSNKNKVKSSHEIAIKGIDVSLYEKQNDKDTFIASTTSDHNGIYFMDNLNLDNKKNYLVKFKAKRNFKPLNAEIENNEMVLSINNLNHNQNYDLCLNTGF